MEMECSIVFWFHVNTSSIPVNQFAANISGIQQCSFIQLCLVNCCRCQHLITDRHLNQTCIDFVGQSWSIRSTLIVIVVVPFHSILRSHIIEIIFIAIKVDLLFNLMLVIVIDRRIRWYHLKNRKIPLNKANINFSWANAKIIFKKWQNSMVYCFCFKYSMKLFFYFLNWKLMNLFFRLVSPF